MLKVATNGTSTLSHDLSKHSDKIVHCVIGGNLSVSTVREMFS